MRKCVRHGTRKKDALSELNRGEFIMFMIYNSFLYRYIKEKNHFEIVTYDKNKIDNGFMLEDDIYYKEIQKDDKCIQDIFKVQFFLKWDSHFDDVDEVWEILLDGGRLKGNQVLLKFAKGILPGWTVEEQTVCSKYVDIDECEDFSVVYTYTVKDGNVLKDPMVVEQKVSKEEFQKIITQYQTKNI